MLSSMQLLICNACHLRRLGEVKRGLKYLEKVVQHLESKLTDIIDPDIAKVYNEALLLIIQFFLQIEENDNALEICRTLVDQSSLEYRARRLDFDTKPTFCKQQRLWDCSKRLIIALAYRASIYQQACNMPEVHDSWMLMAYLSRYCLRYDDDFLEFVKKDLSNIVHSFEGMLDEMREMEYLVIKPFQNQVSELELDLEEQLRRKPSVIKRNYSATEIFKKRTLSFEEKSSTDSKRAEPVTAPGLSISSEALLAKTKAFQLIHASPKSKKLLKSSLHVKSTDPNTSNTLNNTTISIKQAGDQLHQSASSKHIKVGDILSPGNEGRSKYFLSAIAFKKKQKQPKEHDTQESQIVLKEGTVCPGVVDSGAHFDQALFSLGIPIKPQMTQQELLMFKTDNVEQKYWLNAFRVKNTYHNYRDILSKRQGVAELVEGEQLDTIFDQYAFERKEKRKEFHFRHRKTRSESSLVLERSRLAGKQVRSRPKLERSNTFTSLQPAAVSSYEGSLLKTIKSNQGQLKLKRFFALKSSIESGKPEHYRQTGLSRMTSDIQKFDYKLEQAGNEGWFKTAFKTITSTAHILEKTNRGLDSSLQEKSRYGSLRLAREHKKRKLMHQSTNASLSQYTSPFKERSALAESTYGKFTENPLKSRVTSITQEFMAIARRREASRVVSSMSYMATNT